MSDRPGSGGAGDGPEFGWLYGQRPGGADNPSEATQKLPVQPRPGSAAPPPPPSSGPSSGPPTERLGGPVPSAGPRPQHLAPTPQQPHQQPGHPGGPPGGPGGPPGRHDGGFWAKRLRRPGFYVRAFLVLLLVWVLFIVAVLFITWQSAEQVPFEPDGDRPAEQDGTTYLLVGSDSRSGLTAEERKRYATGNPKSELTDTIMLLHTGAGPSVLVSVPRDLLVEIPGFGQGKINSAYARGDGAASLVQTLEGATGIRIDKYVEIGLGGVVDVVDAVGGIEVCPKKRINDPKAGLKISKGCQEVDGEKALAYSRSRVGALSDLERVQRQREVVSAVGDQVLSPWTVINPVRWYRINKAVPSFFTFGEGMSSLDASRWGLAMSRVGGSGRTCTLPVTLSGNGVVLDEQRADALTSAIADDDTDRITDDQCTATGVRGAP